MPRNKKTRKCCAALGKDSRPRAFKPAGIPITELQQVRLGMDELEALRLCDKDGLTQEQAGARMGVSRGTVQRLLSAARSKVAEALTGCKAIALDLAPCEHIKTIKQPVAKATRNPGKARSQ